MTDVEFYARFFPIDRGIDEALLDRLWTQLDAALSDCPLRVIEERGTNGATRVIEVLRLLAFRIRPPEHRIDCFSIEPDGSHRAFDIPMRVPGLFDGPFWLRFVFQRWAPESSRIDFIEDPHNRPSERELRTSGVLLTRLHVDRRYSDLAAAFDAALGTPAFIRTLMIERERPVMMSAENVADAWATIERTNASLRRIIR